MKDSKIGFFVSLFFILNIFLGVSIFNFSKRLNLKVNEIFLAEEYQPANIIVNTDKVLGYLTLSFSSLAQGGEEMGVNMLAGTEEKIKKLNPQYIRIDHIFDDDYYGVYRDGNIDFSNLDKTVDSILAMGAKPFFSLGYMPGAIASSKISEPSDYNKWQELVKQTILHYSKNKQISDIYYEVWNEPDLESFGAWKYYGQKSYLKLYDYAARGARQAKGIGTYDFKIGGPGITALYKNWVIALVSYTKENNLPLDFISWHRYSYYPQIFQQDMEEVISWVGDKEYEFIISEWGPDSEKTNIYASNFAAAHFIASADKFIETTDFAFGFEVKDGPLQEDFGWGILDYNKNNKPRYRAMEMAADMYGDYLELTGEGSSISGWGVKEGEKVKIILANYDPKAPEKENFPISFVGLTEGNYNLSWLSLKGKKGNEDFLVGEEGEYKLEFEIDEFDVVKLILEEKVESNSFEDLVKGEKTEKGTGIYFSDFE